MDSSEARSVSAYQCGKTDLGRTCSTEALPTLFKADPRELQISRLLRGGKKKKVNGNIPLRGERKMIRCSTSVIQKEGWNSSAYRPKDEPYYLQRHALEVARDTS